MARVVLERQPCEVCGNPDVVAHHDDYTKPLEVRWLCRSHHAKFHRRFPGHTLPGYEQGARARERARNMVGFAISDQVKISAKVPEIDLEELRELAIRNGRSVAAELRIAIHDLLLAQGYIDA